MAGVVKRGRVPEEKKKRAGPKCQAVVMEDLLSGEADIAAVSRKHFSDKSGSPLQKLATWYEGKGASGLMIVLRRLLEDRADLMTAHARAMAARRMFLIARDEKEAEVARKACVDLLKLPSGGRVSAGREAAREVVEETPEDEEKVRLLMAKVAAMGVGEE